MVLCKGVTVLCKGLGVRSVHGAIRMKRSHPVVLVGCRSASVLSSPQYADSSFLELAKQELKLIACKSNNAFSARLLVILPLVSP